MSRFSRRDFFKFLGTFIAFVPAIRSLSDLEAPPTNSISYPLGLQDPTPPPLVDEDLIAEKYDSGIAKMVSANQMTIENYKGEVIVYISDETDIWDGIKWIGDMGADVGDEIVAWGNRNADNSLSCEKLYINIVNFIGEISEVKVKKGNKDIAVATLVQNDRFRGHQLISIDPSTVIDDGKTSRKSFREWPMLPSDQEVVQIIGRTMSDGTTLAAIVYLSQ